MYYWFGWVGPPYRNGLLRTLIAQKLDKRPQTPNPTPGPKTDCSEDAAHAAEDVPIQHRVRAMAARLFFGSNPNIP